MTAKEFINKKHPKMVDNWSHQASLLSYGQVAKLMEDFQMTDEIKVLYLSDVVPGDTVVQFKKEGKVEQKYFKYITVYSLSGFESEFNEDEPKNGYIKYMEAQEIRDYYGFDYLP